MNRDMRSVIVGLAVLPTVVATFILASLYQSRDSLAAAPGRGATTAPAAADKVPGNEPGAHDPVIIKEGDYFYVYYTGGNVRSLRSKDLNKWEDLGAALPGLPDWVHEVGINANGLWAPDIQFFGGKYHLYYAASAFGSRNSGIGVATNVTLDPNSPNYKWQDPKLVFQTHQTDDFNAIDPNVVLDEKGTPWMDFGSFWQGIKMRKLMPDGMAVDPTDPKLYALATRVRAGFEADPATPPPVGADGRLPGGDGIEGPFIIHEGKYYYLFVSWDRCCRGLTSTYRVMVGRSDAVTGPYVDKDGKKMIEGGGTQLLAGDGDRIIGPGHNGMVKDGNRWLMVHHFYDGYTARGTSKLQVRPVTFDAQAWPVVGAALNH